MHIHSSHLRQDLPRHDDDLHGLKRDEPCQALDDPSPFPRTLARHDVRGHGDGSQRDRDQNERRENNAARGAQALVAGEAQLWRVPVTTHSAVCRDAEIPKQARKQKEVRRAYATRQKGCVRFRSGVWKQAHGPDELGAQQPHGGATRKERVTTTKASNRKKSGLITAKANVNTRNKALHPTIYSRTVRTWPFVSLETVRSRARQPTKAGVGVVALEDVGADRRGSPVSRLDRQRLDGGVAAGAVGVLQHERARRLEQRLVERAVEALGLAPVANGLKGAPRLSVGRAVNNEIARRKTSGNHRSSTYGVLIRELCKSAVVQLDGL